MRGSRIRGEHRLEEALEALAVALDASGAPWMIIGGLAVIARGVRRMTSDIDAVVQGDAIGIDALMRRLSRGKIVPRIKGAAAFARANLVLLVRHEPTGVDLDVSMGWTSFETEAIAARDSVRYGRVTVPMARPEDLLIFKTMAARPKDIEDAKALLVLHRDVDLARIRRRLTELAVLADMPELVDGLEAAIAAARSVPRRKKRKGEHSA